MNKKGFELGVTTLILISLGVLFLIIAAFFLTDGFSRFKITVDPYLSTSQGIAFKNSCDLSCKSRNLAVYCCNNLTSSGHVYYCTDDELELNCNIDCSNYKC